MLLIRLCPWMAAALAPQSQLGIAPRTSGIRVASDREKAFPPKYTRRHVEVETNGNTEAYSVVYLKHTNQLGRCWPVFLGQFIAVIRAMIWMLAPLDGAKTLVIHPASATYQA